MMRFAAFVISLFLALPASAQVTTRPPGGTLPFSGGTITTPLLGATGCDPAPAYSFTDDTNAGLCLNLLADFVVVQNKPATTLANRAALALGPGTAAMASWNAAGTLATGFFSDATGVGSTTIRTAGTDRFTLTPTEVTSTLPILAPDGSVSAPSYGFTNFTGTGLWHDNFYMNMSVGGFLGASLTTAFFTASDDDERGYLELPRDTAPTQIGGGAFVGQFFAGNTFAQLTESSADEVIHVEFDASIVPVHAGGTINYCVVAHDGGEVQQRCGKIQFAGVMEVGATTAVCAITPAGATELTDGNAAALSLGTLTYTWGINAPVGESECEITLNAVSSLTQSLFRLYYTIDSPMLFGAAAAKITPIV